MAQPQAEFPPDTVAAATYAEALAGMVDRPFLASQRWQDQQHRAVRFGAHPDIVEFERLLIKRMAKLGVPLFAPEVVRSAKRQDELYALGNSKAKGGQSAHQYGLAVDLVHSVHGWNLSAKQWEVIEHMGRELAKATGLKVHNLHEPDGSWSFYDPAHWQVVGWKGLRDGYPFGASG